MREPRVAIFARQAVVVGNDVYCAGGMTAMAVEHAASSRMPAGIVQSLHGVPSVLSRMSSPPLPLSLVVALSSTSWSA